MSIDVYSDIKTVWSVWTQPDFIRQWNHASDDWHCPSATNDLKAGGMFSYIMAARDGSASFNFNGTYTTVINQKQIGYVIEGGRTVHVTFEQFDGYVRVTEIFDPETENAPELQRQGWQAILGNFKKVAEVQNNSLHTGGIKP